MRRYYFVAIGIFLILTFIAVFWLAQTTLNTDIDLESVATPTERSRTDVPEIGVGRPTPTPIASPTPRFTIEAPPGIEFPEDSDPEETPNYTGGTYPISLAIEELGILAAVVVVQTDDTFTIVTPREEVGYYALTPKIGTGGNSVMIGHVAPGRVFNKLLDAQIGQIIRITDEKQQQHYYQINEIVRFPFEIGSPEDHQIGFAYVYDNSEERITLVTCYPEYTWTHRFVVRAVPVSESVVSQRQTEPPANGE